MWLKMFAKSSYPTVDKIEYEVLPEDAVATIAGFTSPQDACCLAVVSKIFRSAAESNPVWEQFLPSDYCEIIARSDEGNTLLLQYPSKKKLYFGLADHPLLIDGSTKSFWLEKFSGKKCFMISAASISIIWSDTPRYWRWTSIPESRFPNVAQLLEVYWFEIRGRIDTSLLSPHTNYRAYLIFKLTNNSNGFDGDVEASVEITGGETITRNVFFLSNDSPRPSNDDRYSTFREDGWLEMMIGSFFSDNGEDEVQFSVLEITRLDYKSGLTVEGIEVRPCEIKCGEV